MKFTFVGEWYNSETTDPVFSVVGEGATYEEAQIHAAGKVLREFFDHLDGGQTAEDFWWSDHGAYICAAFQGDMTPYLVHSEICHQIN
ncbi:hypothetical protein ACFV2X_48125 [Streptomyces sp. NPDC059679]|uniref:hypothetical protein n=1 Tax=Streptomyces sp. NPDC059679 TaxID=3346903 RepID=UPI0036B37FBB